MSGRAIDAQRRARTIGDYPIIARHLLPIGVETVEAVGIRSGDRVLDVGLCCIGGGSCRAVRVAG